ncbi:MAG: hypothetical protein GY868_15855, partial [Deltaproteobacteria bacterium]|nr:hypothetical protein [Deltaproteobacteria bacterium]
MQLRSAGIILIACILIAGVVLYVWRTGSNQKSAPATPRFSAPVQPNPSPLDGRGTARIIPAHAIPVSFPGTWQIEFTTDAAGIAPGGGIVFHISPFWGWTGPQNYDQSQPGYCTVSSSNSDISLKVTTNPKLHYVMVSTAAGSLQANDQVTLTYGDTQNGRYPRARALADKYAEQNERFFIKVDGDGDGAYAAIRNNPALSITAKPAVRLLVSAPSLAAAGETITITVAPIDQLHNRAPVCSTPINLVAQPSVTDIALKNTEGGTHIFEARLSSPGIYSFSAADKNKTISGTSNPVLCSRKHPDQRIYWGDLHGHSQLSDGTGTPDDYFAYARYVSGLDVAALTDHDAWGFELLEKNPLIWEKIKQSARSHNV